MTRKQINQNNMLLTVRDFLKIHSADLSKNPEIAALLIVLSGILDNLEALKALQAKSSKPATLTKLQIKMAIIAGVNKLAAALAAYAKKAQNNEILAEVAFTDTYAASLRENDLATLTKKILEIVRPVVENLIIYDVVPAVVEDLDANYKLFLDIRPKKRTITDDTKQATADIAIQLKKGMDLMNHDLKTQMKPIKSSNPTLFGIFLNACEIVDTAATHNGKDDSTKGDTPA